MKKTLLILILLSVLGVANDLENVKFDTDNFNLLCINPLISEKNKKSKVYKAISKGYARQLTSLTYKVNKFSELNYKHYITKKYNTEKDEKASTELMDMLNVINDYYERNDKEKSSSKTKANDGFGEDDEELDFSESDVSELTKQGENKKDEYKAAFDASMIQIEHIYDVKNESGFLGFGGNTQWKIPYGIGEDITNLTPNVIIGEYFNPSKKGRRYYLAINIFIFILDSDGDSRVMVQEIGDYNWKRNYRFITAQSAKTIQDTVSKMTNLDIK